VINVVIDTNVFVSSFLGGHPRKVLDLWKTCQATLCASKAIIDEYIAVLQRLGLQNEQELEELLQLFGTGFNIIFTTKTAELHIVEEIPDHDKFLECAVSLTADFIISEDKSLTAVQNYMGISIVTPKDFLEIYGFET